MADLSEDPQGAFEEHVWGSEKALKLHKTMRDNESARRAYNKASAELGKLFTGYVEDAGLKEGTRVRLGNYVTNVVHRSGGGGESPREWSSVGHTPFTAAIK